MFYSYGDVSKPWYLVNPKIAGKWMFIPLKMVLIGIDPYPYSYTLEIHSERTRSPGVKSSLRPHFPHVFRQVDYGSTHTPMVFVLVSCCGVVAEFGHTRDGAMTDCHVPVAVG